MKAEDLRKLFDLTCEAEAAELVYTRSIQRMRTHYQNVFFDLEAVLTAMFKEQIAEFSLEKNHIEISFTTNEYGIHGRLSPTYQEVLDFFENEYIGRANDLIGTKERK